MAEQVDVRLRLHADQYKREAQNAALYTRAIGDAAASASSRNAQFMRSMQSELRTAGVALAGFGASVGVAFGAAAKVAIDWESAFTGVRKTVNATEEEFADLERGIRDMALEIPVAATELAGIAEAAGQLGIETPNILEFTETMAKLGVTTNLTSTEAATAFARIANVMQVSQDQFDEMGATVVDLGNNFATTESEIVEFANRIAAGGQIAGFTVSDVLSLGAAFSSVGVGAERGGTAVQKVLTSIVEAVATGSDELTTFAQTAGLTVEEFSNLFRSDAAEAFTLFVEGLGRAGEDAFGILQDLGLQDQRLIQSFLSVAGAGDLLRESIERGSAAFEENTALTDEAAERFDDVAQQLQLAKAALFELGIEIGNIVLPALIPLVETARDAAQWFSELPDPVKKAAVAAGGLAGAVSLIAGGLLLVVPRLVATIDAIRRLREAMILTSATARATSFGTFTLKGLGTGTLLGAGAAAAGGYAAVAGGQAIGKSVAASAGLPIPAQLQDRTVPIPELLLLTAKAGFQLITQGSNQASSSLTDFHATMDEGWDVANRYIDTQDELDRITRQVAKAFGISEDEMLGLNDETEDLTHQLGELEQAMMAGSQAQSHLNDELDKWLRIIESEDGETLELADAFDFLGLNADASADAILRVKAATEAWIQAIPGDFTGGVIPFGIPRPGAYGVPEPSTLDPNVPSFTRNPQRAHGGDVWPRMMYRVGEGNLPELYMIPGDRGRVLSNSDTRSLIEGGGTSVTFENTFYVAPDTSAQEVARQIRRQIERFDREVVR